MAQVVVAYARKENPSPWAKLAANASETYF